VISRRVFAAVAAPILAVVLLAGCTENPSIASADNSTGYVSGNGQYTEIKPADRKAPVSFSGLTDAGKKVSSSQFLGTVHVLNFWYAGCGPCILEAPRLEKVYKKYKGTVPFLGVNTYDQAPTALNFEKNKGVTYPSVIDVNTVSVQYAFSASIPANSVPTTLVIDKEGRVAARVTGLLEDPSILSALIDTVVSEGK
jgi:thiol-disulfide isomerase/thioredoxin